MSKKNKNKNKNKNKKKKQKSKVVIYPKIDDHIDDTLKFCKDTLNAINEFKTMKPWRGTIRERRSKLVYLHRHLCEIYGIDIGITFDIAVKKNVYLPDENLIVLKSCSVLAFLHEFAHARGRDEKGANRWSLNLFKRCFPKSFEKNNQIRQALVKKNLPVIIKKPISPVVMNAAVAFDIFNDSVEK
jgi:hypothetical protein